MEALRDLLERFDTVLKRANPVNYNRLRPPLSEDRITALLKQLDCEDENMRTLFAWKDGFDPLANPHDRCMIFKYGSFLCSLSLMVIMVDANKTRAMLVGPYLPLLSDDTGQFLLFNNGSGNDYGKIHLYSSSLGFIDPVSYYDSIPAMIETTLLSYEQGALVYDDAEDWLDEDQNKYFKIAKTINSNSDYWRGIKIK